MKCPRCQIALKRHPVTNFEVDTCPGCAGIWFEDGELKALKDSGGWTELDEDLQPTSPPMTQSDQLHCPKCGDRMDAIRFNFHSGITLNECMKCFGTWIDDGELTRMAEALQQDEANRNITEATINNALKEAEKDIVLANWELEHRQTLSRYRRLEARVKALMTNVRRF